MSSRRKFLKLSSIGVPLLGTSIFQSSIVEAATKKRSKGVKKPVVISTWRNGIQANEAAWKVLSAKGESLDAVEQGVMVVEADPKDRSVGYGGRPDKEGNVTLDACIMDHMSNVGAVAYLKNVKHAISVARKVMEETPHAMIVGDGAYRFAMDQGFKHENLLTPESEKEWKEWLKKSNYKPVINIENHDTIGMLALDENGNISGSCTTSGAAWKMPGRVGDSPIIGAGLFLDNEVGGAVATGLGEAVIRTAATTICVEYMRMGMHPQEAAKKAIERICDKHKNHPDMPNLQVGILALNKNGEYGGFGVRSGFNYAICDNDKGNRLEDAGYKLKWD
ncbi:N(4)-(beta-N-acetylglucosaminyl)-L-asparaginase [Aureibacter tunicatorum]|uniref:N4-(Beta-N-acetylglucosaminyl)-L-asparaginase n=1 Tax=Aureibacter tunicatorum TaxID=866807 RepID=A0AAE4BSN8_9BACT|nr:N(4)-(beta-N-acetylglucosaminyl)-L-asparaginase [Aureibacter tunicatorum]MDR6238617.1 N4-(beta-N-acetylglucosaminyl)-L-asparaginase [Aureibacter tunicatorum]